MKTDYSPKRRPEPRRIAISVLLGAFLLYGLLVTTSYAWVYFGLKNHRIEFSQVALLRWGAVRRDMAAQQFADAQAAFAAHNYQAAYLAFSSAVRNDPGNVEGRLAAASFFAAAGVPKVALDMLEDGLRLSRNDPRLIAQTFALLMSTGENARVLELLRGRFAGQLSGPNGPLLQTYEIAATLDTQGAEAAARLMEKYPRVRENPPSAAVIARVQWESHDRIQAIRSLAEYVRTRPPELSAYQLLTAWQRAAGMLDEARQTAQQACADFPGKLQPRILLIETLGSAGSVNSASWEQAAKAYLSEFGGHPEAIPFLAELAGRKGWVLMARSLYETGAMRGQNLELLALYYSDALAARSQWRAAADMLAQVEAQMPDENSRLMALIRERQVIAAASLGDHDGAREFARRLAAVLSSDAAELAASRRRLAAHQIPEAVAELSAPGAVRLGSGGK